jgi:hypothetical protein
VYVKLYEISKWIKNYKKKEINKESKISDGKNGRVQKINERNKKKEVKLKNVHVKLYEINKWIKKL